MRPYDGWSGGWAREGVPLLTDEVIAWIRRQLDQPRGDEKEPARDLRDALVGRELPEAPRCGGPWRSGWAVEKKRWWR